MTLACVKNDIQTNQHIAFLPFSTDGPSSPHKKPAESGPTLLIFPYLWNLGVSKLYIQIIPGILVITAKLTETKPNSWTMLLTPSLSWAVAWAVGQLDVCKADVRMWTPVGGLRIACFCFQ